LSIFRSSRLADKMSRGGRHDQTVCAEAKANR
jgi:hypothetical protein